jgi:predicted kinase
MTESLNVPRTPIVVRFSGLPGVGKTTFLEQTGVPFVDVDRKRKELFGYNPVLPPDLERAQMEEAYKAMYLEAAELLSDHPVVAVGATFRARESRNFASQFASRVGARLFPVALVFFDETEEEIIIKRRLAMRNQQGSDSNIRTYEEYLRVKSGAIPYDEPGTLLLDAAKPIPVLMYEFKQSLAR